MPVTDMYASAREAKLPRWDVRLWITVAVCMVLLIITCIPIVASVRYQQNYRNFWNDLADSSNYAQTYGTFTLEMDGQRRPLDPLGSYQTFLRQLSLAGSGRVGKAPEEQPAAVLEYGDGARMELWSVPLEGYRTTELEYGLFVRFTNGEGKSYGYDTEALSLESVLSILNR